MALIDRVRNMILTPAREWPVVAQERTDPAQLVTGYLLPLAAVSAVAGFIGSTLLLMMLPFVGVAGGLVSGLIGACISMLVIVLASYLFALIVNLLAPYFGARADYNEAFKTAVYTNTPGLAAGVLQIIPVFGTFVVLLASLYGIYVLYLGLPHTMKVPPEKQAIYLLAIIATCFVLGLVFWILMLVVFGVLGLGMAMLS